MLFGVTTEGSVMSTALGLLQREKKVTIVVDAVGSHNTKEARLALRKMEAKGSRLIETKKLVGDSHLRHVGICSCKLCRGGVKEAPIQVGIEY
jgi:nicotinamidase-related amidase